MAADLTVPLTTYQRCLRFCAADGDAPLSDTPANRRQLIPWINAVSQNIEHFLNRPILIADETEYFNVRAQQTEFAVRRVPVITLTDVYQDIRGLWQGGESIISDCFLGDQQWSVCTFYPRQYAAKNAIRIRYNGGLAATAVMPTYAISTTSGTWAVGGFVQGGTSMAIGIVRTASATSLVIEVLYGLFQVAETISQYSTEDANTTPTAVATVTSCTIPSLVEVASAIVMATEMQVRYMWRHRQDFENAGVNKDGQTMRRLGDKYKEANLEPEVINLLWDLRREPIC